MLFFRFMGDTRALDAVRRIERALGRIEAAASRPRPAAASSAADEQEFRRLSDAHDALRRRVAGAIGRIDDLIDVAERP